MAREKTQRDLINEVHQAIFGVDGQPGLCNKVEKVADQTDKNKTNILKLWFAIAILLLVITIGGGIGIEKILAALSMIGG